MLLRVSVYFTGWGWDGVGAFIKAKGFEIVQSLHTESVARQKLPVVVLENYGC